MDGDHRMKQHEALMARSGNSTASGHVPDRFDSNMHPRGVGGGAGTDTMGLSQAPDRAQMSYDYGYTGGSFHGGSLQPNDVVGYTTEFTRRATASSQQPVQRRRRAPQDQQQQQHQQQQQQQQQHPSLVPYESAMLYGFNPQQGPTQGSGTGFEVVPQYSTRQSAAIEALSNQFAVPPYFNPEETSSTGVPGLSPYLNTQANLPYNHPGSMQRPNNTTQQPFSTTMTDFASIGTGSTNRIHAQPMNQSTEQPAPQPDHDLSSLDEADSQYQRALRTTFDHIRDGRLLDASRSLQNISEWLVTHARDLGILRDDHLYKERLQLWNDFNICWLAVCQKQKDLTQDFLAGSQSTQASLLSRDCMESMGKKLIQLCDQLEQYGLVDYQMGIWEEEILCVLGQCLDLMESRPDLLHIQTVLEPATAAPRP